jgi:metal-responsive CopG/Arc/MetJ family transcriptional regulator
MISNMKTIAITIDDDTLTLLDRLVPATRRARGRSALVRLAVRQYVDREQRRQAEARDAVILARHRRRLAREVRALISVQAGP